MAPTWSISLSLIDLKFSGNLLCRTCGNEVTQISQLMEVPSKLAHRQRNDSFIGSERILIQLFKNPQEKYFEVVTAKSAEIHKLDHKPTSEDSWFPGFSWTIVVCPRCGSHIGWLFEANHKHSHTSPVTSFYGLILNHLLLDKDADSIIEVPKVYTS
ncbi:hypothetical protein LOTGIDRAFT_227202 [Lottia gigantea]|uniref:Protein yippee-like n=1 Tax=Lottia gigantea TaxID=225164 RepID=V4ALI2_LOTGI|nr:hypothetical protein LOTGIDRAFT_227202 [Lottia gigantea]ESO95620.1 hypothetical protein LOTGIDRAFT_227202 [Lottia gigantea]